MSIGATGLNSLAAFSYSAYIIVRVILFASIVQNFVKKALCCYILRRWWTDRRSEVRWFAAQHVVQLTLESWVDDLL